jgi:hypothetical protein
MASAAAIVAETAKATLTIANARIAAPIPPGDARAR